MDESELNAQGLHDDRKREVADLRRLVEEAQQRSATWQHNHEDALKAAEEARADAKRNALSNIELRIEVDRLKGELAASRLRSDALESLIDTERQSRKETENTLFFVRKDLQVLSKLLRMVPVPGVPAAPPVTGDGVETKRTMPWPKPACSVSLPCGGCFTRGICDQLMWESGEAAGLARGRELGARDEKDHARAMEFLQEMSQPTTCAGGCAWCGGFDEHGDICELRDWLAEIEARRAGREGK